MIKASDYHTGEGCFSDARHLFGKKNTGHCSQINESNHIIITLNHELTFIIIISDITLYKLFNSLKYLVIMETHTKVIRNTRGFMSAERDNLDSCYCSCTGRPAGGAVALLWRGAGAGQVQYEQAAGRAACRATSPTRSSLTVCAYRDMLHREELKHTRGHHSSLEEQEEQEELLLLLLLLQLLTLCESLMP